jgi:hypothetical protein
MSSAMTTSGLVIVLCGRLLNELTGARCNLPMVAFRMEEVMTNKDILRFGFLSFLGILTQHGFNYASGKQFTDSDFTTAIVIAAMITVLFAVRERNNHNHVRDRLPTLCPMLPLARQRDRAQHVPPVMEQFQSRHLRRSIGASPCLTR